MARTVLNGLTVSGGDLLIVKAGYPGLIINSQTSGNPYFAFQIDGADKGGFYYDRGTDRLIFQTAAADRAVLNAAGNFIIGSNAVILGADGTVTTTGAVNVGSSAVVLNTSGAVSMTGALSTGGDVTMAKVGYVGAIINSQTSGNPYFAFQINSVDKASVYYDRAADKMVFFSAGADRASLTAAGEFAVGANAVVLTAAGVVTATGIGNFSTAGIRTKHESASTPTGGSSGEVRVGTDKLWANDGGTWKSTALSAAGAPSFASMAKWGTD